MKERREKWLRLERIIQAEGKIREVVERIKERERTEVVRVRKHK